MSRPFSPEVVNMLCRFRRVLSPEADRRFARSMNAAPVELERLDKLPNCAFSMMDGVVERRILEIDMQRLPSSSFFGKVSVSFLGVVGDGYFRDVGNIVDFVLGEDTGSS